MRAAASASAVAAACEHSACGLWRVQSGLQPSPERSSCAVAVRERKGLKTAARSVYSATSATLATDLPAHALHRTVKNLDMADESEEKKPDANQLSLKVVTQGELSSQQQSELSCAHAACWSGIADAHGPIAPVQMATRSSSSAR